MDIVKKIVVVFQKPKILLNVFLNHIASYIKDDATFIKIKWKLSDMQYPLNLENPRTFSEKLQWLKLHDRHSEYTQMVDKATAKDYVASIVGDKYIIPTYGIWNSVDEIEWDKLPNKFVVKATSDSGGVIICKDKSNLNIQAAVAKLKKQGSRSYYYQNREYPYRDVPHRYIAEAYMEDESGYELKDYKFFCFNGEPKFVQIDFDRYSNHRRNVYDINWNLLDLQIKFPKGHDRVFPKPENYDEMVEISRKLSKGIPHVRIDLYNANGKIYFGEITFFHGSGMEVFTPLEWDYKFGEFLKLPI